MTIQNSSLTFVTFMSDFAMLTCLCQTHGVLKKLNLKFRRSDGRLVLSDVGAAMMGVRLGVKLLI